MATRFVKCSYQEVVDLHTESDKVTAIGIHTPTGDTPRKMFKGYFDQYKRYKYYGASIKFVPAARLPADLEGVSYAANEPGVDPRDLMNPILVHGCHGNDMGTILNKLYGDNNEISDSADRLDSIISGITQDDPFYDAMERLYYKALTDTTWKKANVQRGFKKTNLRPLVYSLAVNHQIMPGFGLSEDGELVLDGGLPTNEYNGSGTSSDATISNPVSNENIKFFTPRLMRLGWMDTRQTITNATAIEDVNLSDPSAIATAIHQGLVNQVRYSELEKLFMLMILLPPAYKTEVHFRCIISHHFGFKDFRGISFMPEQTGVPTYHGYEWKNGAEVSKDFPEIPVDPLEGE